ncbi:hypothetical protein BDQ17DRAFT_1252995 [Cyathus striatus]|nr:hypothetical protein BDQ17DRAFT_1261229 [Cyathus striatus]KAF8993386.1 hypothetical protein BDQ17DRAFT_1252995 [Cyathus striatus]
MADTQVADVSAVSNSARGIGCDQQGTPHKPAECAKPNCPSGYRSVFWDYGCPDHSWKCCI